jgi:hypothetical protein
MMTAKTEKPKKPKIVKIDGRIYPSEDDKGVIRFVGNKVVMLMHDADTGRFDINTLRRLFNLGMIPLKDYMDFHTMIGYSVEGFIEVFSQLGDGVITVYDFPGRIEINTQQKS